MAAAALFVVADFLIQLPWNVYASWWREKQYALTSQALPGWFADQLIGLVVAVVTTTVFFIVTYALIRHARRTWWLWMGALAGVGLLAMITVEPLVVEPLLNTYTPAPAGPMRDAAVALAKTAGVPDDKIYIFNGSKQSNRYTANVSGLFGSARVAMSDVMFKKGADVAQVRATLGHEMGHYSRHHLIWFALIYSLLAVAGFGLVQLTFPMAARLLGAKGVDIADPAGLPVIMAIVATLSLLATPLTNTVTRTAEADADAFGLRVANEPDGMARALIQTSEYRAPSPSDLEEFLFYDHPSVEHRVRRAMDWKASHPATTAP